MRSLTYPLPNPATLIARAATAPELRAYFGQEPEQVQAACWLTSGRLLVEYAGGLSVEYPADPAQAARLVLPLLEKAVPAHSPATSEARR